MNWIQKNHIDLTNVEIFSSPDKGTGLRFTSDNPSGIVLRVSKNILISANHVRQWAKDGTYLEDKPLDFLRTSLEWLKSEKDIIVLFLALVDAKGSSDMSDYVKGLPAQKDMDQPWSWSEDEIFDSLRGTSLLMACVHKKGHVSARYEAIVRSKGGESLVSESQFLLAEQWVVSRSLEIPNEPTIASAEATASPGLSICMVPVLDFVNHAPGANCRFEVVDNGDVVLVVNENVPIKSGDEVFINYGPDKSAAEFLFCYGFIDANHGSAKSVTLEAPLMLSMDEIDPGYLLSNPDCDPELKSMILKFHSYGGRSRLVKLEAISHADNAAKDDGEEIIAKVDCDWLWMLTLPTEDVTIDETTAATEFKGVKLVRTKSVNEQVREILGDKLDEYMTESSSMKEDIADYVGHLVRQVFIPQLEIAAKSNHPMAELLRTKERAFLEAIDDIEV